MSKRFLRFGTVLLALLGLSVSYDAFAAAPAGGAVPAELGPAVAAPALAPGTVPAAMRCADLKNVDITDIGGATSRVTSASQSSGDQRATCIVEGTLAPAIHFKLQLPVSSWTGRLLEIGCGGTCGRISSDVGAAANCEPLHANGFAIAATDMGHQGMSSDFGLDPQKRRDFAYRSVHLTADVSKKLIRAFYARAARYAYFSGCSDGGREALIEAQRFPDDFDGIIAGAEAMNFQTQNALYHAWQAVSNTGPDGKAIVTAADLPLLHQAVLDKCDAIDGQKDGLITDPRACRFDPAVLQCKPGEASTHCLSAAKVAVIRKFYEGPRDPKTGERLILSGPQLGSELNWAGVFVPQEASQPIFSSMIALGAWQYLSFQKPQPDIKLSDIVFDQATFDRLRTLHPLYDATNPDLSAFAAHGGKLILWHGWADPHISPLNTIAYHEAVHRTMGDARAQAFERLYLLPGVSHCGGGQGPNQLDLLTPMLDWVEHGTAPNSIVVSDPDPKAAVSSDFGAPTMGGAKRPPDMKDMPGMAGMKGMPDMPGMPDMKDRKNMPPLGAMPMGAHQGPRRFRPVYPYPMVAVYDGHGDPLRASSYVEHGPLYQGSLPEWAGSDFYQPYVAMH